MSAVGTNGKELITEAGQNYLFALGFARYQASITNIANWKSILEIGLPGF